MPEIHNPPIYSTMIKALVCCRHCSSIQTIANKTMKVLAIYSTWRDRQTKYIMSVVASISEKLEAGKRNRDYRVKGCVQFSICHSV